MTRSSPAARSQATSELRRGLAEAWSLLQARAPADSEIVGVDLTAADVARENLADLANVTVHEGDLLGDLSKLGQFDFIYCQEVLHHTPDTARTIAVDRGNHVARWLTALPPNERDALAHMVGPLDTFDDLVREAERVRAQVEEALRSRAFWPSTSWSWTTCASSATRWRSIVLLARWMYRKGLKHYSSYGG